MRRNKILPSWAWLAITLVAAAPAIGAARADPVPATTAAPDPLCRLVETAATANSLPVEYLTRLLWTESGFSSNATSPAGAEGIAQFMPQTAAERGLLDPRDPEAAITHAARFLVELDRRFGNLGLAAAAYNAGPARITRWLQDAGSLPAETRAYVRIVTGEPVEAWAGRPAMSARKWAAKSCSALIAELKRSGYRSPVWETMAVAISAEGDLLARKTGQPVTVGDRLSLHHMLDRAVGLSSYR